MAANSKKKASSKTAQKKTRVESTPAKRQLKAVIWFAIAVFFLFVVLIPGQNVWTWIHNQIFGIFGVMAFLFPLFLGFIAVTYTVENVKSTVKLKTAGIAGIVILIDAAIDLFLYGNSDFTFSEHLSEAYSAAQSLKSGGFIGFIIGHPLDSAFGNVGAIVTVILLIFVLLMIITGTSLLSLFKTVSKPVKVISDQAETAYKERIEKAEKKKLKVIDDFQVDIPVDDVPEKRKKVSDDLNDNQRKVVSAYYGEDLPEEPVEEEEPITEEPYEGAEDKEVMTKALKRAAEESEKEPEEKIDFKEETKKFTDDLNDGIDESADNGYVFPPLTLLKESKDADTSIKGSEVTAEHLVETLRSFGVETRIVNISRGPTVTRYELQPCAGVKISKITNLADDIALNLATAGVRIEAPIPNKAAVGIEVPNKSSDVVGVRGILESPAFTSAKSKLTFALGRDIGGNAIVADIGKMPHGLIAGATGSGKSVCINSIIISLLYKADPEEVKLLMIDPKVVELGIYNGIPHLLVPVVTDPRKASGALGWAVSEMEKRYKMFADRGVRDLAGYNRFVENLGDPEITKMPHIVIIIDELADLMMTAPNEVEDSINRIAAKARAAGMHLIIATQRPSVDVVTGVIKANIPTRIAFAVSSQVDSRTILDSAGAEKLLGRGDMLFSPVGSTKPNRIQGCFVSDEEVESVVEFIKSGGTVIYDDNVMVEIERQAAVEKKQKTGLPEDGPGDDPMLEEAIKVVVENGMASTSLLQRKLKLGYARAARIVDEMEQRGVVGPYEGSKPRKVLITKEQLMERELSKPDGGETDA